ncbi:MAG: methionyl-tRNA formyltransferase, partial [Planctomycetota bacterium]
KLRKVFVIQDGLGEIQVEVRDEAFEVEDAVDRDLATHTIDQPDIEEPQKTRVVFMGSPSFAVPSLLSLVGVGMTPVLVVTPPPKAAGRGRRRKEVAVAREAKRLDLPLHRTGDINARSSRDVIEEATPDAIVTAGFGQKLGSALLDLPRRGCINLHASLLPKYRGASPVAAALRDGAAETGVTMFVMQEELDDGPILASQRLALTGEETADEVTAALGDLAADLLIRTLPAYMDGEIEPQPQDHEQASYVPRLRKAHGKVPWDQPAISVKNHIRAVTTWPGAQSAWQPKVKHDPLPVVLLRADLPGGEPPGNGHAPGTVLAAGPEGIEVACGEGVLRILRLRPEGGRPMDVKDFLNARRVVPGDRFL